MLLHNSVSFTWHWSQSFSSVKKSIRFLKNWQLFMTMVSACLKLKLVERQSQFFIPFFRCFSLFGTKCRFISFFGKNQSNKWMDVENLLQLDSDHPHCQCDCCTNNFVLFDDQWKFKCRQFLSTNTICVSCVKTKWSITKSDNLLLRCSCTCWF